MLGNAVEISVVVRDLEAAVATFTQLFGLEVHSRHESKEFGFKNAILPTGIGHIELMEPTGPASPRAGSWRSMVSSSSCASARAASERPPRRIPVDAVHGGAIDLPACARCRARGGSTPADRRARASLHCRTSAILGPLDTSTAWQHGSPSGGPRQEAS